MTTAILATILAGSSIIVAQNALALDCNPPASLGDAHECAEQALKTADKQLNKVYRQLMSVLKKQEGYEEIKYLKAAQKLWIKFRDADCEFVIIRANRYSYYLDECLEKATSQRTTVLEGYLADRSDSS
jgi:uncharacterized protein YecT (DUF1311 family)